MEETLLYNGRIYSEKGEETWMVIKGNKIFDIGSHKQDWKGERIDLEGRLVLPGFQDSHIHVYSLGRFFSRLNLKGVGSIAALQSKLKHFAEKSKTDWIIGGGWDQDTMEEKRYPNKNDLDEVIKQIPVLLYRGCNHIGVANSIALKKMGINEKTQDPEGGQIDRDEEGNLTGILRENALDLVSSHIDHLDNEHRLNYFRKGIEECLKVGLTAVHTNDSMAWDYYKTLQEEGQLPIRVFLTIFYDEVDSENTPEPNAKIGLLQCKRIKLFADGSLGAETAALREPYHNSSQSGILIQSPDELKEKIADAHKRGYQLEVHAIGDLAAEVVIDGFEASGIREEDRAIITHCQVLGQDLINKMSENGYIANIQPPFVPTDSRFIEKRLGKNNRLKYAYAWKTLLKNHVYCAGGSDAPIESQDPLYGIYTAMKRPDYNGNTWRQEECLSFDEALHLYTSGAAYVLGFEDKLGKLLPGYLADFVVVDAEILENSNSLLKKSIRQVWVDGKLRYSQ